VREMPTTRKLQLILLIFAVVLLWGAYSAGAVDISALGDWSETIDASRLIGGAGGILPGTYESATDQSVIAIQNTFESSDSWRVDISRLDTNWPAGFILSGKRTSDGSGGGSITGGAGYQIIETTDAAFFSGAGDRSGIDIQLKLTGMTIQILPGTYSTTLVFTLVDT
jgi:hypothetical protein